MNNAKDKILNCSIIEFFESDLVLGIKNLSPIQKMTLKAIRGEPLDATQPIPKTHSFQSKEFDNEVEMFKYFSGKSEYTPTDYSEASLCFGRRSGKSCSIGSGLAIYYATQFDYTPYLGTSPHATIPIISASKEQAGEVYTSIKNFCMRSPYLFSTFLDGKVEGFQEEYLEDDMKNPSAITGGKIKLNNRVIIKVMAADLGKVRGMAAPFAILDEVCFFGVEGNDTKNTDKSIYEALAPSLAQFQTVDGMALVLKISSPNGQAGLMYEDYENRKDPDILHIQVPTWYANPSISVKYLEKQRKKGISFFNREYGAEYTASETAYLDPNLIDTSIIRGTEEINPMPNFRYVAAMDYATKGDYWYFAIGHKEYILDPKDKTKREKIQIDYLSHWRGKPGEELNPDFILAEIAIAIKKYRVSYCLTDQYAFAALRSLSLNHQINLKEFKTSHQSKLKYMYSLQIAINSDIFRMVHDPLAVRHLKDLREKRGSGANKLRIEHSANCHDDAADAIALVVYQFDRTSPVYIGYHYDEEVEEVQTKDAMGNQLLTPFASEVASKAGVGQFYDNRDELDDKKKNDPNNNDDDDGGMWFSF